MNQQFRPNRFGILPPVIKNLLIINGLFYLATQALGRAYNINLIDILGLHYIGASDFKPYQYITYMFMHSATNFSHILFNMFALWMFGNTLENVWGSKKFLIYYLITGIGAAIIYTFWIGFEIAPTLSVVDQFINDPSLERFTAFTNSEHFVIASYDMQNNFSAFADSYDRLIKTDRTAALIETINYMSQYRDDYLNAHTVVGASGAVYGILLAFGMMFPNSIIYLYFAIPIKAKWLVIGFGLLELISGISQRPGDNVAHFAHLGGMIFGLIIILYWKRKGRLF
jgi:membrane associated rhomboid family serine protease